MTSNDHRKKATRLPHPAKARERAGLTQRKLAEIAGTTQVTVFRCEKSGRYPKHCALRRSYLAALNLTEKAQS